VGVAYRNKIQELKSQNLEEEELEKKLELLKVSIMHMYSKFDPLNLWYLFMIENYLV